MIRERSNSSNGSQKNTPTIEDFFSKPMRSGIRRESDPYPFECITPAEKEVAACGRPVSRQDELCRSSSNRESSANSNETALYSLHDSRSASNTNIQQFDLLPPDVIVVDDKSDNLSSSSEKTVHSEFGHQNVDNSEVSKANSRCPSNESTDSISQELSHFKPIQSCPRTPPRRLPSGKLMETLVVRTTPRNLSRNYVGSPANDCLSPEIQASSPFMQRRLQVLAEERKHQVKALSKATSTGDNSDKYLDDLAFSALRTVMNPSAVKCKDINFNKTKASSSNKISPFLNKESGKFPYATSNSAVRHEGSSKSNIFISAKPKHKPAYVTSSAAATMTSRSTGSDMNGFIIDLDRYKTPDFNMTNGNDSSPIDQKPVISLTAHFSEDVPDDEYIIPWLIKKEFTSSEGMDGSTINNGRFSDLVASDNKMEAMSPGLVESGRHNGNVVSPDRLGSGEMREEPQTSGHSDMNRYSKDPSSAGSARCSKETAPSEKDRNGSSENNKAPDALPRRNDHMYSKTVRKRTCASDTAITKKADNSKGVVKSGSRMIMTFLNKLIGNEGGGDCDGKTTDQVESKKEPIENETGAYLNQCHSATRTSVAGKSDITEATPSVGKRKRKEKRGARLKKPPLNHIDVSVNRGVDDEKQVNPDPNSSSADDSSCRKSSRRRVKCKKYENDNFVTNNNKSSLDTLSFSQGILQSSDLNNDTGDINSSKKSSPNSSIVDEVNTTVPEERLGKVLLSDVKKSNDISNEIKNEKQKAVCKRKRIDYSYVPGDNESDDDFEPSPAKLTKKSSKIVNVNSNQNVKLKCKRVSRSGPKTVCLQKQLKSSKSKVKSAPSKKRARNTGKKTTKGRTSNKRTIRFYFGSESDRSDISLNSSSTLGDEPTSEKKERLRQENSDRQLALRLQKNFQLEMRLSISVEREYSLRHK